uniref:Uncharacterized protein n=1 Tax=Octopus bimaculoides TaxID=37653 RepID=A0A0L8G7U6_OCTBM
MQFKVYTGQTIQQRLIIREFTEETRQTQGRKSIWRRKTWRLVLDSGRFCLVLMTEGRMGQRIMF